MYDVIIVGSSPISCINSIYYSKRGKKVLMIDKNKFIGGSWSNLNNGFGEIDIGCHIWSLNYKIFDFINKFLKIKLIKMEPQPVLRVKNLILPYYLKLIPLFFRSIFKEIFLNTKYKKFSNYQFYKKYINSKNYLIPRYGFKKFINRIKDKLSEHKIAYNLNCELKYIKIRKNDLILYLNNKKKLYCNKLEITSNSKLEKVLFKNDSIYFPKIKNKTFSNIHVVANEIIKRNSYVRIIGDDMIKRLSFYYKKNENVTIIIISTKKLNSIKKINLFKIKIIDKLLCLGYLKNKNNVKKININNFHQHSLHTESIINILKMSNNKIRYTHSTDLIFGMTRKIDEWSNTL